ncbi:phosphotransferase [Bacillus sp. JCM 19041]|uniref:phosphotransferase enzyme family protein n=1 Tax=Bacillus sp. JCM 19041 TaxID=1460637 RepID=UPI000A72465A
MDTQILEQVGHAYGVKATNFELLGGFENNVFLSPEKNIVIKLLDTDKYNEASLLREIEIVTLMEKHGIKTSSPQISVNNKTVEFIQGVEKSYFTMAFSKVDGTTLADYENNPHLVKQWGKTLGKMHQISKQYGHQLRNNDVEWNDDIKDGEFTDGVSQTIKDKWKIHLEQVGSLSLHQDWYGVVHHDLHHENILMSGEELYVIDFGDVRKSWYIYDVAIPIYTALEQYRHKKSGNEGEFYQWFTEVFLSGYCEETSLSDEARKWLPFFLEYRLLYSYLYFLRAFKGKEINAKVERILEDMRTRIEKGPTIY